MLKRMYLDRINGIDTSAVNLTCKECKRLLGVSMIYEKEQRSAYRLFAGSITKKIVKQTT